MQQFIVNMYRQSDAKLNRDRSRDLEMLKMGCFFFFFKKKKIFLFAARIFIERLQKSGAQQ
jgi:hypothetical protein